MTHLMPLLALILTSGFGMTSPQLGGRKLVFEQDFTSMKSIDLKEWMFDDGPVYNDELEKYTSAKGGNAFFHDKALVLEARKDKGVITSARLQSYRHWKYPYVEVEARVPKGRGTWPAIWMLGDRVRRPNDKDFLDWPRCGEIDIMENVGFDPDVFAFSLHTENQNFMKGNENTKRVTLKNPGGFHKFAMECKPEGIRFIVDGITVYNVPRIKGDGKSWPYDDSFYMILNLAIGGNWGGAKGVDDAIFPSRFVIRSVRVYQ